MRHIFLFLLLMANFVSAETRFSLERLAHGARNQDSTSKITAPPDLQEFIKEYTKDDYKNCVTQLKAYGKARDNYFGFSSISLTPDNLATFLVYPSENCYAYFGGHSIQFWVVEKAKTNSYRVLLTARQDALKILSSKSNGYADLITYYNSAETRFRYDGKKYDKSSNP